MLLKLHKYVQEIVSVIGLRPENQNAQAGP